tara:strand:+ start:3553 stop:4584 length:1032 start_codon:yes stop_codon:yes gene_type:complete
MNNTVNNIQINTENARFSKVKHTNYNEIYAIESVFNKYNSMKYVRNAMTNLYRSKHNIDQVDFHVQGSGDDGGIEYFTLSSQGSPIRKTYQKCRIVRSESRITCDEYYDLHGNKLQDYYNESFDGLITAETKFDSICEQLVKAGYREVTSDSKLEVQNDSKLESTRKESLFISKLITMPLNWSDHTEHNYIHSLTEFPEYMKCLDLELGNIELIWIAGQTQHKRKHPFNVLGNTCYSSLTGGWMNDEGSVHDISFKITNVEEMDIDQEVQAEVEIDLESEYYYTKSDNVKENYTLTQGKQSNTNKAIEEVAKKVTYLDALSKPQYDKIQKIYKAIRENMFGAQ